MHPLTVVTGVLLGSAFAIFFGLAVVGFIFFLLAPEHPRLQAEIRPLLESVAIFLGLTTICGISFIGQLRVREWRWFAQAAMWGSLVGVGLFYT